MEHTFIADEALAVSDLTALAPNSAVAETELGIGVSFTALASANDFQLLVWPQPAKRIGELLPYNWSPPVRSDGPTASCSRS